MELRYERENLIIDGQSLSIISQGQGLIPMEYPPQ